MQNMPPETSAAPGRSSLGFPCWRSPRSRRDGADGGYPGEDQVDVQAPSPGQVLGEHPAKQQPDRAARPGDRAVDSERLAPLLRVAERHGEQRQRRRREQRPERALAGPRRHQHAEAHRSPADRGRDREAEQADQERHLPPEQVTELAAQQQQAAERQRVRGDHPLPVHDGEAQRLLRRRQRDVHDRGIENDHELREGDHAQDQPPVICPGGLGPGLRRADGLGHGVTSGISW